MKPEEEINAQEAVLDTTSLSLRHFDQMAHQRLVRIGLEFKKGFKFIRNHPRSVSFFGSARFTESNEHYIIARELAGRLSKEGYTIVTGSATSCR